MPGTIVFMEGVELGGWDGLPAPVMPVPGDMVPAAEDLRSADLLLLIGQFQNTARMQQLAGVVNLVMPQGALVVVVYPRTLGDALRSFLWEVGVGDVGLSNYERRIEDPHPLFADYFSVFGESRSFFNEYGEGEVLGSIGDAADQSHPAAACLHRGQVLCTSCPITSLAASVTSFHPSFRLFSSSRK